MLFTESSKKPKSLEHFGLLLPLQEYKLGLERSGNGKGSVTVRP